MFISEIHADIHTYTHMHTYIVAIIEQSSIIDMHSSEIHTYIHTYTHTCTHIHSCDNRAIKHHGHAQF